MADVTQGGARKGFGLALRWTWPQGAGLHYCVKAALASGLGYALSWGGPESAVYGAMGAALIVGASRGEDIASSANRVRGTLAGMAIGVAMVFAARLAFLPPVLAASLGIGFTAYVSLAFGWGVPAARVGAALCVVMVLAHGGDALSYSAIRVGNTLIGIGSGLIVSHFVLTITAKEAASRAARESLSSAADLLDALSAAREPVPLTLRVAMLDSVVALEKAIRDGAREFNRPRAARELSEYDLARQVGGTCAGALTAAIAHSDLCASPDAPVREELLRRALPLQAEAARLAMRARSIAASSPDEHEAGHPTLAADLSGINATDAIALQGMALGLRKFDAALGAMRL